MYRGQALPLRLSSQASERHDRLPLIAVLLLVWSVLYALPHLYWGLGGPEAHFVYKPSASEGATWEAAHLFAFGLNLLTGFIGFGLLRTTGLARQALLLIAGCGAAIAGAHGVYGIAFRAASVLGISDVEGAPFDIDRHGWVLWDLLAIEPWFVIEGLLLALVGFYALTPGKARSRWVKLVGVAFAFLLFTAAVNVQFA